MFSIPHTKIIFDLVIFDSFMQIKLISQNTDTQCCLSLLMSDCPWLPQWQQRDFERERKDRRRESKRNQSFCACLWISLRGCRTSGMIWLKRHYDNLQRSHIQIQCFWESVCVERERKRERVLMIVNDDRTFVCGSSLFLIWRMVQRRHCPSISSHPFFSASGNLVTSLNSVSFKTASLF